MPLYKQSSNMPKEPAEFLMNNGWPEDKEFNTTMAAKLKYLEIIKH